MIEKIKTPYEFLIRLDGQKIVAAHVRYLVKVVETIDGVATVLAQYEDKAQEVALAVGDPGFPIEEVLSPIQLATITDLQATRATLDKEVADRENIVAAKETELVAEKEAHRITKEALAVAIKPVAPPPIGK